jgi:hypothetical protein
MEKKSQDSIKGDNYLPRKYRDWKKEEKTKQKREKEVEEEVKLPEELESMMKDIGDEDINEIAGERDWIQIVFHFYVRLRKGGREKRGKRGGFCGW